MSPYQRHASADLHMVTVSSIKHSGRRNGRAQGKYAGGGPVTVGNASYAHWSQGEGGEASSPSQKPRVGCTTPEIAVRRLSYRLLKLENWDPAQDDAASPISKPVAKRVRGLPSPHHPMDMTTPGLPANHWRCRSQRRDALPYPLLPRRPLDSRPPLPPSQPMAPPLATPTTGAASRGGTALATRDASAI